MLVVWTELLKNPESERVRNLEMAFKEIREAKDELVRLSGDDEQRVIYNMHVKILKDEISALGKAKREGIEEGIKEGELNKTIDIAKNALLMGLPVEQLKALTGLTGDIIKQLSK